MKQLTKTQIRNKIVADNQNHLCDSIKAGAQAVIVLSFRKAKGGTTVIASSSNYGWLGEAGGCGYNKHSTVLAYALSGLCPATPVNTDGQDAIQFLAGGGVHNLSVELAKTGYALTCIAETDDADVYTIKTISTSKGLTEAPLSENMNMTYEECDLTAAALQEYGYNHPETRAAVDELADRVVAHQSSVAFA